MMRSPVESVIRQPMARADSMVSVMLSCWASSLSAADMEKEMVDSALKSTVFFTDLLISLLEMGDRMMSLREKVIPFRERGSGLPEVGGVRAHIIQCLSS